MREHPACGVRAYQGGTLRGNKPAVYLSSARRDCVEIIKLLLRPAKPPSCGCFFRALFGGLIVSTLPTTTLLKVLGEPHPFPLADRNHHRGGFGVAGLNKVELS